MAMVNCKECGAEVSTKARACPKCGAAAPKPPSGCAIVVAVFFGLWLLGYVMSSINRPASQPAKPQASAPTPKATREADPPPAGPKPDQVALLSLTCQKGPIGSEAIGEVENIGNEKLAYVDAQLAYVDSSGKVIDNGSAMADIRPLMPGQRGTFKGYGPDNPLVTGCEVRGFSASLWKGALQWQDRRQVAPAPSSGWRMPTAAAPPAPGFKKCMRNGVTEILQVDKCPEGTFERVTPR